MLAFNTTYNFLFFCLTHPSAKHHKQTTHQNKKKATVKFSAGGTSRGGLVTIAGVSGHELPAFVREDSFDTVDEESGEKVARASAHPGESFAADGGRGVQWGRQSSHMSDTFEVGGEDGEGYWERQGDPASGMAYYLNDKVRVWGGSSGGTTAVVSAIRIPRGERDGVGDTLPSIWYEWCVVDV